MSSIILTHNTKYDLVGYNGVRLPSYLQIRVIFDGTYTIHFQESIPRISDGPCLSHALKDRYIRDIPYFPNSILDAIKLMKFGSHEYGSRYCHHEILGHFDPITLPSEGDEIFEGLTKIFSDKFRSDIKSEEFTQEFTKIKMEYEKTQIELIDRYNMTQTELKDSLTDLTKVRTELSVRYGYTRSIEFELYDVKNQKNVLQQENEKLSDDLKTYEGLVAELRGKISDDLKTYEVLVAELRGKIRDWSV